jgi:predicted dehydrogenase
MARALSESGRHEIASYSGHAEGLEGLRRRGLTVHSVGDMEEMLADPSIEGLIVASRPAVRAAQLRRAVQSERHALCVHPVDATPEAAYEAAMIQADTGHVLLPILVEGLHPALAKLAAASQSETGQLGRLRLIQTERLAVEEMISLGTSTEPRATFPGWDALRVVGGEIAEVFAFAAAEEVTPGEPILMGGRFNTGAVFQLTLLPGQQKSACRWALLGTQGQAELVFPEGWTGPAHLRWRRPDGTAQKETWEAWDPGPRMVEAFEAALAAYTTKDRAKSVPTSPCWQDEVRALELDDAARRSIARRRTSPLEYQDATEEVGFKGTMTLAGCGLLWAIIVLAVLSRWFPWVGWLIIPFLTAFLILQIFRWVLPREKSRRHAPGAKARS